MFAMIPVASFPFFLNEAGKKKIEKLLLWIQNSDCEGFDIMLE